jgi:hypothetical protein
MSELRKVRMTDIFSAVHGIGAIKRALLSKDPKAWHAK